MATIFLRSGSMFEKILIVGASRGLGRSLALYSGSHLEGIKEITLVARKHIKLNEVKDSLFTADEKNGRVSLGKTVNVNLESLDMAKSEGQSALQKVILKNQFDLVIYAAGGGPHGDFVDKEFKDHEWALQVGLVTPMALVWSWLKCRDANKKGKFVAVGSRIAEQNPEPQGSSYAASKHGLFGFVRSLQEELKKNQNKVWLFSPGFMDSELLPLTAKIRHDGSKLMSTETAAQALLRWIKKDGGSWHRVLS
jgi:short-subunit dehydrogenase